MTSESEKDRPEEHLLAIQRSIEKMFARAYNE